MIEVYLIRHGLAGEFGSYANDDERPLTPEGRQKTRLVAKRLVDLGLRFDRILTSPLVRAQQTAELLLEAGLSEVLEPADYLAIGGDIRQWLEWLHAQAPEPLSRFALVGHEPTLSTWAELLLWGEVRGAIELKKAGIIGLSLPMEESPIAASRLFWLTPPRFLLN
jgi:phosphohistidine phosphatase